MRPSGILDLESMPKDFSLEHTITSSMYADNVIVCQDDRAPIEAQATATILALNAFSFKIHDIFGNAVPELIRVVSTVTELEGYAEIHPEIRLVIDEQNRVKNTGVVQNHPTSGKNESGDESSNGIGDGDDEYSG